MSLNRTLFQVEVTESDKGRDYWATRSWVASGEEIRSADVVVVPWENFREGKGALFPQGTTSYYRELTEALKSSRVTMGVDQTAYEEIALHADANRLATILVSLVVLPFVVNLLSSKVDRWISDSNPPTAIEMEMIIEGDHGKCVSIKYKGPPGVLIENITKQAEACLPRIAKPKGKNAK
jgi:hypothetical protein